MYTYSMNKNLKDLLPGDTFLVGGHGPYVATLVSPSQAVTRVEYYSQSPHPLNTFTFSKPSLTTVEVV